MNANIDANTMPITKLLLTVVVECSPGDRTRASVEGRGNSVGKDAVWESRGGLKGTCSESWGVSGVGVVDRGVAVSSSGESSGSRFGLIEVVGFNDNRLVRTGSTEGKEEKEEKERKEEEVVSVDAPDVGGRVEEGVDRAVRASSTVVVGVP